jgi:predicted ester cyclase
MKTAGSSAQTGKVVEIPFHSIRHISCPEDIENARKIYTGHIPITAAIPIPTDENVRDYLLEAEGKKRRVPTQVHRAIKDTLETCPQNFSVLNSGVTIVARHCEIDEKNKKLKLLLPSIINGSQTQGVIKDFLRESGTDLLFEDIPHVKFELIVTEDDDLIAEISIARNFQVDVMTISIAGRRGQLDELEQSLQEKRPGSQLKKSETKLSDNYVKTERLLQVCAALIPEELWMKPGDVNKVYTYSMKTKCLKDFQELHTIVHGNPDHPDFSKAKLLYQFYLDIVDEADRLYHKWKRHQGFYGTRIRQIKRDEKGKIVDVPDGIIFPILASLSAFIKKTEKGWSMLPPKKFSDDELIKAAASAYQEIAAHNPQTMGKNKACYSALYQITSIYKKLSA